MPLYRYAVLQVSSPSVSFEGYPNTAIYVKKQKEGFDNYQGLSLLLFLNEEE